MTTYSRRGIIGLSAALPVLPTILQAAGHSTIHQVSIEGFAFNPASLEVSVGDTIVFTNMDGAPHTATANDGSFDSGRLKRGDTFELQVETAGEHGYFCKFHRSMKASFTAT